MSKMVKIMSCWMTGECEMHTETDCPASGDRLSVTTNGRNRWANCQRCNGRFPVPKHRRRDARKGYLNVGGVQSAYLNIQTAASDLEWAMREARCGQSKEAVRCLRDALEQIRAALSKLILAYPELGDVRQHRKRPRSMVVSGAATLPRTPPPSGSGRIESKGE